MADITKINLNGTDLTIVDSAATSAIAGEIARAQGAESAITSALSAEVVARQSADTQIQTALSGKADASTTLSGYGITDAYTKTEVDNALAGKANTATTYTKSEVDTALAGKQNTLSAGTGIQISGDVISCTVDTGLYVVVTTLPAQPAAGNENKIHLVPLASGSTGQNDYYEEYLWKGDAWEYLGVRQAEIDLSDYWTSAQTQSAITSALSDYYTSAQTDSAITSAITDAIGENLKEYDSVENVLSDAGIAYYDDQEETYVVEQVATQVYVENEIGESMGQSISSVFVDSGVVTRTEEGESVEFTVNTMATEDYVDNALSGITASYSAATETLILNIPNPSA